MPVLCLGPVCIPLNLLLPFLLGIAHRYGWLKWIKREWLTLTWWKQVFSRSKPSAAGAAAGAAAGTEPTTAAGAEGSGGDDSNAGPNYVCEGGVCRLVPPVETDSTVQSEAADDNSSTTEAAPGRLRHRKA